MNKVCGVLHLSSKVTYGSFKNGAVLKRFTPFDKSKFSKANIKTKKKYNPVDVYVVVIINSFQDIPVGVVDSYIGEIGHPDIEFKYLKAVCTCDWLNNKMFKQMEDVDIYSKTRTNLNYDIYSIDPQGCIDIDDAVHARYVDDVYYLDIHIADVSSYVNSGCRLDTELAGRCQSIYLQNLQINMLPDNYVESCSLVQGSPKRVFSVMVQFDKDFNIINSSFVHNTIVVKENMSYEHASGLIDTELKMLYYIGKKLYKRYTDKNNYDVHVMIETFMIIANVLAARRLKDNICPLLRRHKECDNKKLYDGVNQKLVEIANNLQMLKAEYCIDGDTKHAGLKQDFYTHFTSPIRRYADIIVHRLLHDSNYVVGKDLVDNINMKQKIYGKCEKISNDLAIIYSIGAEVFDAYGNIVGIDIENNKIKVYVEKYALIIDVLLFSRKINHLVDKKMVDDLLCLSNSVGIVTLAMFQKIYLKLAISKSIKKLLVKIIDPEIHILFNTENLFILNDDSDYE